MMSLRTITVAVAIVLSPLVAVYCQEGSGERPAVTSADESIGRWVRELDDDSFVVREEATGNLIRARSAAIPAVTETVIGASLEASCRAIDILTKLAGDDDQATRETALSALEQIARLRCHAAGRRAAALLSRWKAIRQEEATGEIRRLGGTISTHEDLLIVRLGSNWKGGRSGLAALRKMVKLPSLSLEHSTLDDDALAEIAAFTSMERLFLGESRIQGPGLVHLKNLRGLNYLSLKDLKIKDADLKHVAPLRQLDHLGLDGTPIGDAGLVHLKTLTRLRRIWLNGTNVTDAGLAHLKDLKSLSRIELPETAIDGSGLMHLKDLPGLTHLSLNSVQFSAAGWEALGELTRLEQLELKRSSISDADLVHLRKLKNLENLYLADTRVTQDGIARLKKALPDCQVSR